MQCALALEETVNKSLLDLHEVGNGDPEVSNFGYNFISISGWLHVQPSFQIDIAV